MMKEAFPTIVDVNFTANMEALLDGVSEGTVDWKTIVSNFYPDLEEAVQNAEKELEEVKVGDEESDEVCELCGRRMVIKYGPHGRFLACRAFRNAAIPNLITKNRRSMPQVWQGYRPEKDTEGQKILWLYRQPGVRFHGMAEAFQ